MSQEKQIAFVAYASSDPNVALEIQAAVSRSNAQPTGVRFEPWTFNDVAGVELVSPIISRINESRFIVADITTLNKNVVYEIGYAIGKQRRAFLVRCSALDGDRELAKQVGIFDTLGYFEYKNETELYQRLTSHIDPVPLPISQKLDHKAPVYIVESPFRTDPSIMLASRIKKAGYRFRSFNPIEDIRLSASDAIRQVASSAGIAMLLEAGSAPEAAQHNIRAMFVAGLSIGMGKPTLVLNPAGNDAPLDVRDFAKGFRHPDDIREQIANFCPDLNVYLQQIDPPPVDVGGSLESLSLGDPTAENEMTTLQYYYLRTEQYKRALRGEANLVVGRKGSGKTALFLQLRDKVRADKRNVVVDLQPEGYQVLKLKERVLDRLSDGSQQHLVTAFWEYLILLEVAHKILQKDQNTYKYNHDINELYVELMTVYKVDGTFVEGDFSERLSALSARIVGEYQEMYPNGDVRNIDAPDVSKILYVHDIRELRRRILLYLKKKQEVWVLFDNLDKGWNTQGVDVIDARLLRCLIDAGRKVEREMGKDGHLFHCIIFIRNDVYDHLMQRSADYGKEMRATLDWTDTDLLKEVVRLRLVATIGDKVADVDFQDLWRGLFDAHVMGVESADYIVSRSLMRPRNVLKIVNHCKGVAVNLHHAKILEEDIKKGLTTYSQDLVIELDRELRDVCPVATDVLYYFIDCPPELGIDDVHRIIMSANVSAEDVDTVMEFLLYYGVLGVRTPEGTFFIFETNYDLKPLQVRLSKAAGSARFVVNEAFWPALGVRARGLV